MKSFVIAIGLAAAVVPLGACSNQGDTAAAPQNANPTGLVITNARLMLPPVAGNPAAIYFDIVNDGKSNVAIRSAAVKGAKSAVLHDMMMWDSKPTMGEMPPLMLTPGMKESFKPGGKHVMAYDLSPDIKAGGTTEMTLTIAGGDTVTTKVPVMAAGDER